MADLLSGNEEGSSANEKCMSAHTPTGKGPEENLHQFFTARRSKFRLLTTKSNQIEGLMEDDNNVVHVDQIEMKSYKKLYEEFIELNQSVRLYLREDEIEADQTSWFEPKASCCRDFVERVEAWVEDVQLCEDLMMTSAKDVTPMDSVSNASSKQKSGSFSSRSSQASSPISSVTSVRRREEANRAALIARAEALKEKRALALKEAQLKADQELQEAQIRAEKQMQEAQIKADKEQLEIDTELAALAARLKIYADYDALQQQSGVIVMSLPCQQDGVEGQVRYEASAPSLKRQERPVLSTNEPAVRPKARADQTPVAEPLQQDNDTGEFQSSRLQQRDIPLFHGDPLEFRPFLKAINQTTKSGTDDDVDKWYFLEQYTRGKPQDLVRSCHHKSASHRYDYALKLLNEHYGNEMSIASTLVKKAYTWPKIQSEDKQALSDFSLFLVSCCTTVEDGEFMDELDNPTNMRAMASKLPCELMEKWRWRAYEIQDQRGSRPKFVDLVKFVDSEAKAVVDPMVGNLLEFTAAKREDKDKPEEKRAISFVTNATPVKTEIPKVNTTRPSGAFSKPCLFCERNHTLEECQKTMKRPHKGRFEFLKKSGLCFGCFAEGCARRGCKKRMTCIVC